VEATRELTLNVDDAGELRYRPNAALDDALELGHVGHAVTVNDTELFEEELVGDRVLLSIVRVQKKNTE
jgi:hypothetical protein